MRKRSIFLRMLMRCQRCCDFRHRLARHTFFDHLRRTRWINGRSNILWYKILTVVTGIHWPNQLNRYSFFSGPLIQFLKLYRYCVVGKHLCNIAVWCDRHIVFMIQWYSMTFHLIYSFNVLQRFILLFHLTFYPVFW